MPVTSPDDDAAVANGFVQLHTPPAGVQPSVTAEPIHTDEGPVMAAGKGFTVTGFVLKQVLV